MGKNKMLSKSGSGKKVWIIVISWIRKHFRCHLCLYVNASNMKELWAICFQAALSAATAKNDNLISYYSLGKSTITSSTVTVNPTKFKCQNSMSMIPICKGFCILNHISQKSSHCSNLMRCVSDALILILLSFCTNVWLSLSISLSLGSPTTSSKCILAIWLR